MLAKMPRREIEFTGQSEQSLYLMLIDPSPKWRPKIQIR